MRNLFVVVDASDLDIQTILQSRFLLLDVSSDPNDNAKLFLLSWPLVLNDSSSHGYLFEVNDSSSSRAR